MFKKVISGLCTVTMCVQVLGSFSITTTAVELQGGSSGGGHGGSGMHDSSFNYNGHSYYVFSDKASSWEDAQRYCESLGGYLAVIDDAEENKYLYDLMKKQGYDSAYFGLTLSYNDDDGDGEWHWEHHESSFLNWDDCEPSGGEYEGMFYWRSSPYKWNDGNFGEVTEFICEWDYEDAKLVNDVNIEESTSETYTFSSHRYQVVNKSMTWSEARKYCEQSGGYLATITSSEEQAFIKEIIELNNHSDIYWLGATDEKKEGQWEWITGEKFSYENWCVRAPDNFYHEQCGYENYLGILGKDFSWWGDSNKAFKWNDFADATSDGENSFCPGLICEWDDAPTNRATFRVESAMGFPGEIIPCKIFLENNPGFNTLTLTLRYDEGVKATAKGSFYRSSYYLDSSSYSLLGNYMYKPKVNFDEDTNIIKIDLNAYGNTVYGDSEIATVYYEIPTDAKANTIYPLDIVDLDGEIQLKDGQTAFPVDTIDGGVTVKVKSGNEMIYNGHKYSFFDGVANNWEDAKAYCEALGGYLAVINDADENTAVYRMMRSVGLKGAYFGYTDSEKETEWKWVSNDSSTYENWHRGDTIEDSEPNNGQGYAEENYAMFFYKYTNGEWNDGDFGFATEDGVKAFICEWDKYEKTTHIYENGGFDLRYTPNEKVNGQKVSQTVHFNNADQYSLDSIAEKWNSSVYNTKLASVLSVIASSAYTPDDLRFNLDSLGFSTYKTLNYYHPTDSEYKRNSVAYSIAKKELPNGETLVLIPMRGSFGNLFDTVFDDGSDWNSNFKIANLGKEVINYGFLSAAAYILDSIQEEFGGSIPSSGVKYVLTGHSRAAGVGNLVAKLLIDGGVNKDNIFDYNFACPDVIKDNGKNWNPDNRYSSIFNLNVPGDIVSVVPGALGNGIYNPLQSLKKQWGKYGNSYWFASDWNDIPITNTTFSAHDHGNYVNVFSKELPVNTAKKYSELKKLQRYYESSRLILTPIGMRSFTTEVAIRKPSLYNASAITTQSNTDVPDVFLFNTAIEIVNASGDVLASVFNDEIVYHADDDLLLMAWTDEDERQIVVYGRNDVSFRLSSDSNSNVNCVLSTYTDNNMYSDCYALYNNINLSNDKLIDLSIDSTPENQTELLSIKDSNGAEIETVSASSFIESGMYGDVNKDKQLLVSDAVLLCRFTAEDDTLDISSMAIDMADVNCDDFIDLLDVMELLRTIVSTKK